MWSSTLHRSVVLMIKEHWVLVKMWGVELRKWICGRFQVERVAIMHRSTISDNFQVEWVAIVHRTPMLHGRLIAPASLSMKFEKKPLFPDDVGWHAWRIVVRVEYCRMCDTRLCNVRLSDEHLTHVRAVFVVRRKYVKTLCRQYSKYLNLRSKSSLTKWCNLLSFC